MPPALSLTCGSIPIPTAVVLDGVFAVGDDATPVFHPLPSLYTEDVVDLLQVIRVRVLNLLERRGVIEDRAELTLLDDGLAERGPALAQLAAAAVSGLFPAGPELRQRPAIARSGQLGVEVAAPLCVTELGLSLHAGTRVDASDERGREALVRYALRPPRSPRNAGSCWIAVWFASSCAAP